MDNELEKTERRRRAVINFLYWGMILLFAFCSVKYILPVLMPFVIAYMVAWMLNKPVGWLNKKTKIPRAIWAILMVIAFFAVAVLLIALIGTPLVMGVQSIGRKLPKIIEEGVLPDLAYFFDFLEQIVANIDPAIGAAMDSTINTAFNVLSNSAGTLFGNLFSSFGGFLTSVPAGVMKTLITLIASVFIASDFDTVKGFIGRLIPEKAKPVIRQFGQFFGHTLPKCLLPYLLIFTITFFELWIGLAIVGVNSAATVAILISLMDILPVLGTGTILIPWALISLMRRKIAMGIKLIVLYVVIAIIRNTLEPKLVGHQIHLHPVMTFASMLVGVQLFGFIGMFGVPLLVAFLRELHDKGIIKLPGFEKKEAAN